MSNIRRIIEDVSKLLRRDGYFIFTYEALLPNHNLQKLEVQYNASGYIEKPLSKTKFKLYRRDKEAVTKILSNTSLKIIRHYKFRAFLKGPAKIPVFYNLVLAKNK